MQSQHPFGNIPVTKRPAAAGERAGTAQDRDRAAETMPRKKQDQEPSAYTGTPDHWIICRAILLTHTVSERGCSRTLDLTGAETSGAYIDVAGRTLHDRLYTLYIGLPSPAGCSVGVRDLVAESHALAAYITLCHQ